MTSKDTTHLTFTRQENLFRRKICEFLPKSKNGSPRWCGLKIKDFNTILENPTLLRLFHAAHEVHHKEKHKAEKWEMYACEAGPIYYVSCKCKKGIRTL